MAGESDRSFGDPIPPSLPLYERELDVLPDTWIPVFTPQQIQAGLARDFLHLSRQTGAPDIPYCQTTLKFSNERRFKIQLNYHDLSDPGDFSERIQPYDDYRYDPKYDYDESFPQGYALSSSPWIVKILADDLEDIEELSQAIYTLALPNVDAEGNFHQDNPWIVLLDGYNASYEYETIIEDFPLEKLGGMQTDEVLIPDERPILENMQAYFTFPNSEPSYN